MNKRNNNIFTPVYLGIGTNLGNKEKNIELTLKKIEKQIGNIVAQSAFYCSEPFGFESENHFINCAIEVNTTLNPYDLLLTTQSIEREMGRFNKTDAKGYSDRIIDIDILLYSNQIINDYPQLIVPHPQMQKRSFVLKPLAEIASEFKHPILNKTIFQLLDAI